MSKRQVSRTATVVTIEKKKSKEWPIVVYVWALGLALVSYVIARIVLNAYPHPYHWGTGIAGALFGIGIGWLWDAGAAIFYRAQHCSSLNLYNRLKKVLT